MNTAFLPNYAYLELTQCQYSNWIIQQQSHSSKSSSSSKQNFEPSLFATGEHSIQSSWERPSYVLLLTGHTSCDSSVVELASVSSLSLKSLLLFCYFVLSFSPFFLFPFQHMLCRRAPYNSTSQRRKSHLPLR